MRCLSLIAVVFALCVSGCAGLKCPGDGGPQWVRATSEHFEVLAPLEAGDARAAVQKLETLRAGLHAVAWHGRPVPPGRLTVMLLRGEKDLQEFAPDSIEGFVAWDDLGEKILVAPLTSSSGRSRRLDDEHARAVLTHELSHDLATAFLRRQPRWLAEGLATFLESMDLDERAGTASIGRPPAQMGRFFYGFGPLVRPSQLVHEQGFRYAGRPDYYPVSWLLVRYLANELPVGFNEYQRRLFLAEAPEAAFKASFPDLTDQALDDGVADHLRAWMKTGRSRLATAPFTPFAGEVAVQPLRDAEVHALWANVRRVGALDAKSDARAHAEAAEAVRLDPASLTSLPFVLEKLKPAERATLARFAARSSPNDWRAHALLGESLAGLPGAEAERSAAVRRAVELQPGSPRAHRGVAQALLDGNQLEAAVAEALAAARLDPSDPLSLQVYADALSLAGRCEEALDVQAHAVESDPHGAREGLQEQLAESLHKLELRCGALVPLRAEVPRSPQAR